ncbi:MAG: cysteine desulfurase [Gemmatimonadetes bacterium]|nr:cysteine desulfurase [Gemmatimonadota bacterium]
MSETKVIARVAVPGVRKEQTDGAAPSSAPSPAAADAAASSALHALAPRADFPLLAANPDLHYLDSAATAQKPRVVLDAIRDYYETSYANPHRGAYRLSHAATERFHQARATVARFLGVADEATLIFTRGTTDAINLVAAAWGAANLEEGDEVVVTGMDHHANFVTWQRTAQEAGAHFRIAELTADVRIDLDHLASLLNDRTRAVAFPHISNAVGTINPVAEIVRMVREKAPRAVIVLDGAQSAPHLAVDFASLGVDFYAFSGHKMGGPMGSGGLIGRRALLEAMPPYQTGGDMIEFVHDDRTTWNVLPYKFEAGTPNSADAVGLAAACDYLSAIGMANVRAHEQSLVVAMSEALASIPGVTVFGPPATERSGVVSFALAGAHPHDLATILDEHAVCIRAGHHCCQPLMRRLGVSATARASIGAYTTLDDVRAIREAVAAAARVFGG